MMKWKFILVILCSVVLLPNCKFQTANSVSGDKEAYSPPEPIDTTDESAVRFAAAKAVFKSKCVTCHSAFVTYTQAQWINYQYVVPGSSSTSYIVTKLAGAGSDGNMPPGDALSSENIATIKAWVDGISTETTSSDGSDGGGSGSGSSTPAQRTAAALSVIATSCNACHTVEKTATSTTYSGSRVPAFANSTNFASDSDFVVSGLITPGDASQSWLYRALKTYGTIGTMPKNGSAISSSDAEAIANWINGI
jgi:mono/diheme cytochrome c family protein